MGIYEDIVAKKEKISVVGLGYVGLPLAIEFAKKVEVIGYDLSKEKILKLQNGVDPTSEVGDNEVKNTTVNFTNDELSLKQAKFHIVAVPTPVNDEKIPDLAPIMNASAIVGRNLTEGSIVVFESTVYPGVTEEVCVPILERSSNLKCGKDFKVGYSPERINPGDKEHTVTKITKIVSGMDTEALDTISKVYEIIIEAGVYKAETIKVAEAAKVIENTQRDINIAFINELSIILNKLGIDTKAVLKAAGTKWNFLDFSPGLVGGHCIGVDPYYLAYKSQKIGYHPQVILAGRRINDSMGKYIAENTVKQLIKAGKQIKDAKVLVMGFTFKENVPDIRNTRVIDIVQELNEYGVKVYISDPIADKQEVLNEYGLEVSDINDINELDAIVLAVAHKQYTNLQLDNLRNKFKNEQRILIDIKGLIDLSEAIKHGFAYWRL